ncbi:MAG: hypothetical protein AAF368_03380, partial [Planctomycetota bacterium]
LRMCIICQILDKHERAVKDNASTKTDNSRQNGKTEGQRGHCFGDRGLRALAGLEHGADQ